MGMEMNSTTWTTTAERIVTRTESAYEAGLVATDERVGADAAARFGAAPGVPLPAPVRYPLSAIRIFAGTPGGAFVKRVLRRGERDLWRAGSLFRSDESPAEGIEVAPAPTSPEEGARLLARTRADHLVLLRGGASLAPGGMVRLASALRDERNATILYGDSRSAAGRITRAPQFSPLRLREEDYLGPVVVLSVDRVRAGGGFRPGSGSAALLDLVLRSPDDSIRRLPFVIGVGDAVDLPTGSAAEDAVGAVVALARSRDEPATVESVRGRRHVRYGVAGSPMVSVIIPTRGGTGTVSGRRRVFVLEAVRGIIEHTSWPHYEIVVVADDATPQSVIDELVQIAGPRLALVRWSDPFNFSAKINRGAAIARGEFLVLLNDDTELITHDWLERLVGIAQRPGVGLVSTLLYFEDGAIQHAGHLYRRGGAGHVGFGEIPSPGRHDELAIVRETAGVTAAVALVSAATFAAVGGMSLVFAGNYNDVDLSLKIRDRGLSAVVDGRVTLYHFESQSRDATVTQEEADRLSGRWAALLRADDYDR